LNARLNALDSAFLSAETDSAHLHITAIAILDSSDGRAVDIAALERHLSPLLRQLPIFRKRLREVPLGLDHPIWVESEPDLGAHLHHIALPSPGTMDELAKFVSHLARVALDRDRALWELWLVEGLEGGSAALVVKIHHALLDGVAGVQVLGELFDLGPAHPSAAGEGPASREPPQSRSDPTGKRAGKQRGTDASRAGAPSAAALALRALGPLFGQPLRAARQLTASAAALARTSQVASMPERQAPDEPNPAESPVSGAITTRREVALACVPLEPLQRVRRDLGVKLNDIVLAACAGALRQHLAAQGKTPERPLVAAVPVAVGGDDSVARSSEKRARSSSAGRTEGNQVSAMRVEIPAHLADVASRVAYVQRRARRAKKVHRAMGGGLLAGWADVLPPALLSGAADLYSRLGLADRHEPLANLIVSNVPGPPFGLWCGGHPVRACFPLGPIYEGVPLNLTVMSYDEHLCIGVTTCPDIIASPHSIVAGFEDSLEELARVARKQSSRDRRAPPRRGSTPRGPSRHRETAAQRSSSLR